MEQKERSLTSNRTWLLLRNFVENGYDTAQVFTDFVDLVLNSCLSLEEHDKKGINAAGKRDKYEKRSELIIDKYRYSKLGETALGYLSEALDEILKETQEERNDVLGELYKYFFLESENGYSREDAESYSKMLEDVGVGNNITDVSCGTGKILICGGIKNREAFLYGKERNELFAKICAINMYALQLNSIIEYMDPCGRMVKQWRTLSNNSIVEYEEPDNAAQVPVGISIETEASFTWLN